MDVDTDMAPFVENAEDDYAVSGDESASSGDEKSSHGPAASQKRKRVTQQKTSCELCKARKVKCDRAEPACSWCARHDRVCVYKERRTAGSRVTQSIELEAKINRLDALLHALGRRVEEHIASERADSSPVPLYAAVDSRTPSELSSYRIETNGNGIDVAQGTVNVSSPASREAAVAFSEPFWPGEESIRPHRQRLMGQPVHDIPSLDRTSVQALLNFPGRDSFSQFDTSGLSPSAVRGEGSPAAATTDLPPHDVLYTLVDLYFKHVNTWCPILDRKTTFGSFFGSTTLTEPDRILLHAIVATTLRFSRDPRLSLEMKTHYHEVSTQKVELYALKHVSVEALRALLILSLDFLGTSNGPRGWNLLALIAQNAKHLGLGIESRVFLSAGSGDVPNTGSVRMIATSRPDSWIEDEGRRRLCWMVYLLDRYATIATAAFDFMLDDKDMQRHLPCSYDLFSKNSPVETRPRPSISDDYQAGRVPPGSFADGVDRRDNLGSFSYHCEMLCILSRIHNFLKLPIDTSSAAALHSWRATYRALDAALNTWLQSLPGEYSRISAMCHSDPASRVANWFMLHSVFVTAVVRLHSAAAYPAVPGSSSGPEDFSRALFPPSYHAMQRCLTAVDSLRDITQDVHEANGLDLLGPPFAFALWTAARLLLVHAATTGGNVDGKIDFFIQMLANLGRYWEVAGNYAEILSRVVRRGREGTMAFADMRRCARDLVALTSSARLSGTEPAASRATSLDELDCVDVFDFFNVPKIADAATAKPNSSSLDDAGGRASIDFALADPESDWLGFGT